VEGTRGQTELGVLWGGWDGSWEVEERPVRMRAVQAIVHGKVVQKMHMIVSRCPFTLLMSLAAGHIGIFSVFACMFGCAGDWGGWHCAERNICIPLKKLREKLLCLFPFREICKFYTFKQ